MVGGGGGWWWELVFKGTLVFCFGPNLKLKFWTKPKLNNFLSRKSICEIRSVGQDRKTKLLKKLPLGCIQYIQMKETVTNDKS